MEWETRFRDLLLNAQFTGEKLGCGAYGTVEKVIVDGHECAGKWIHEQLVQVDAINGHKIIDRYYEECELMSHLDHPNITKFLGVCAKPDYKHPVLVMRKLDGNLSDLLEGYRDPNLPLSLKLSVLSDVAKGLHYLHNFTAKNTIIHRDLTVRNVLLTSSMVAQITDFGMSRIVDKRIVLTLSPIPGCPEYMPHEAMEIIPDRDEEYSAHYGPSLDVFSFGHLVLVTLIQNITKNLLSPQELAVRSEVERRAEFFQELEAAPENIPQLKNLVHECLDDDPHSRPSTEQIIGQLESIKRDNKVGTPCPEDIQRAANILKAGEKERIKKNRSTDIMKILFLSALAIFGGLIIYMARSGILIQIFLQFPFLLIMVSGVVFYSLGFLFDYIFLKRFLVYNYQIYIKFLFRFMAVYVPFLAAVFVSLMPPLKINAFRAVFHPTSNCDTFQDPPTYICFIQGKKFYTTVERQCHETADATPLYITSLWIPSKNQYTLKKRVLFHPDNVTAAEPRPPFWIREEICIQEFIEDQFPSTDDKLRVAITTVTTTDTGYISRSDLEEYHAGWYRVSNCMWDVTRLFNYCITGYVSNHYVNLPHIMERLLQDEAAENATVSK